MEIRKLLVAFGISALSNFSYAENTGDITIVNHFNKPLVYTITINPDVLPELPQPNFTLMPNQEVTTPILDLQKETYMNVDDKESHYAFWGVEWKNNHIQFYGYLSSGIAFSWTEHTITFCTPAEYQRKNKC